VIPPRPRRLSVLEDGDGVMDVVPSDSEVCWTDLSDLTCFSKKDNFLTHAINSKSSHLSYCFGDCTGNHRTFSPLFAVAYGPTNGPVSLPWCKLGFAIGSWALFVREDATSFDNLGKREFEPCFCGKTH